MESPNPRAQKLVNVLHQGLALHAQKTTRRTLGDRSSYIGLSDVAQFIECPRMAVLSKLNPNLAASSFSKLMTLQRGHWFEQGVAEMLTASGITFIPQMEIAQEENGVLLKAHLDFTLVWPKVPAVRVLEVKSMNTIPDEPCTSHVTQALSQVSMLKRLWSKPAFSLRSAKGKLVAHGLTLPQLILKQTGSSLPDTPDNVDLEGWLLFIGMTDANAFGPYLPEDIAYENAVLQADQMMNAMKRNLNDLAYAHGFCINCQFCDFSSNCKKFEGEEHPEFEEQISQLKILKEKKSKIHDQVSEIEENLKIAYSNINTSNWITSGSHRFKVSTSNGRESIDKEKLEGNLIEGRSKDDAEKLIADSMKIGEPMTRLSVR